jgi:hypothetical protein
VADHQAAVRAGDPPAAATLPPVTTGTNDFSPRHTAHLTHRQEASKEASCSS